MVRAILDGRKTQTRRVVKQQINNRYYVRQNDEIVPSGEAWLCEWDGDEHGGMELHQSTVHCPYGQPGDQLWVRETHYEKGDWIIPGWEGAEAEDAYWSGTGKYLYAATDEKPKSGYRSWPSIHMSRKASRIQLEIVGVRVERLNDISESDAKNEGAPSYDEGVDAPPPCDGDYSWSYVASFQKLWESINGADSWSANPWVWVVEFKRVGGDS